MNVIFFALILTITSFSQAASEYFCTPTNKKSRSFTEAIYLNLDQSYGLMGPLSVLESIKKDKRAAVTLADDIKDKNVIHKRGYNYISIGLVTREPWGYVVFMSTRYEDIRSYDKYNTSWNKNTVGYSTAFLNVYSKPNHFYLDEVDKSDFFFRDGENNNMTCETL